jgi:RNA polymerase sigma-70 factor (ECF subfamily)
LLKEIDPELLDRCRRSERLAQGRLFQLAVQDAARIVRGFGVRESDLDDAVQDVFVVVFRQLPTFEGRSAFSTWFFQICLNVVRGRRRKAVREKWFRLAFGEHKSDEQSPAPSGQIDAARDAERLMAGLSDKHREVLVLYEVAGLSGPEIAESVGIPLKTVWTRLHHARKNVAEMARKLGIAAPEPIEEKA